MIFTTLHQHTNTDEQMKFDNIIQVQTAIQSMTDWILLNHRENILHSSIVIVGIERGGMQLQSRIFVRLQSA